MIRSFSHSSKFKSISKVFFACLFICLISLGGLFFINSNLRAEDSQQTSHSATTPDSTSSNGVYLSSGWVNSILSKDQRGLVQKIIFTNNITSTLNSMYGSSVRRGQISNYKGINIGSTNSPYHNCTYTEQYYDRATESYKTRTVSGAKDSFVKAYVPQYNTSNSNYNYSGYFDTIFIATNGKKLYVEYSYFENMFGFSSASSSAGEDGFSSSGSLSIESLESYYEDNAGLPYGITKNFWFSSLQSVDFGGIVEPIQKANYLDLDFSQMFAGCESLTEIKNYGTIFSGYNSPRANHMFYYCKSLTSIPAVKIYAYSSSAPQLERMFAGCESATSLDLSQIDVSKRYRNNSTYEAMFKNCKKLTSLDVTNLILPNSVNSYHTDNFEELFMGCESLTSIPTGITNFNLTRADSIRSMFEDCKKINSFSTFLNSSNNFWTTASSTIDVSSLFEDCTSVTSLDLTWLLGTKLTNGANISSLTAGMTGLTSAGSIKGLSYCNKWTSLSGLFRNWSQLTETNIVNIIGEFDSSNATYIHQLFAGCYNLTSIANVMRLPKFDVAKATDITYVFQGCSFTNLNYLQAFLDNYEFMYSTKTCKLRSTGKGSSKTNLSGLFAGSAVSSFTDAYISQDGTTRTQFSHKPTSTAAMFKDCYNISSLSGIKIFNTSLTTNMSQMFYNCYNLTSLNYLSTLSFAKVTNTSDMFRECTKLTNLSDTSGNTINATSLTNMQSMFYNSGITSIGDFSYFKCPNATNMSYMFKYTKLTSLNGLSSLDMSSVTDATEMFSHCASLTSLADNTSSSMKPTALTTTYQMFAYSGVKSLSNMVQFDTSNITNANYMFYYSSINDLTGLSKFPLTKANASAQYMFSRCSSLRYTKSSISNETVDFSGVTNMSYMFANCSSLYDLDNMIIFTLNPKANMSHMFDNCDSLYRITGLSRIDMSRPADESVEFGINLNYMFYDCNNLYYISTTGTEYKTSGVTNMSFMFSECDDYYFNAFDFGCWDLSNVTTMQYMLSYCAYLNTVTFSKATNSTQLTSTSYMFYNTKLQTINNIENFDTSNVVTMNYMFASCKFTTLDISKLNTASVTTTADMFASNSNLTSITFDSEGSTFSTSKVTNFSWMFSSCSKLITINMSNFDTSNATTMSYMFYNCSELTSLDVSTFNTEKVTTVGYMFRNTKIVSLDISNFDLTSLTNSNVNYSGILYQMSSLKELYTPHAVPSTFSISIPSTLYMQNTDGTYSGTNALQNNSSYAPFLSVKDADSGEITKTRLAAKYTISYSGASGATHDNPTEYLFSMEEQVITLTTPIKWAYKFTGWTVGSNTSYSLDANTLTLNPQCAVNISLTMTWKNGDKLTFHAKGADGDLQADDATYSSTQEYYSLENYPYGDLKIPTSAFFDFVGYWDGSDPTSLMTPTSINEANQTGYFDKICVIDQSHELYAKWTKKTFTITFEISPDVSWGQIYENGTGYTTLTKNAEYDTNITYSNNILYIGDDIVISAVANDFIGFKTDFSAWYINGTSDTDHIQYYGNKITSNIIVYAMFIQGIETFTLTIDQPFNVTSNQTDTTIAVTSYGDLSQIPYNSVLSVDANNTLLINTGTTTKQVTITQASITGYSLNFLGWYIGNLKIDNIYLRSNLSATPKFEKVVHSYTLSFNVDEKGTLSNTNISLNYGQSFSVSGNTATHSTQNVVATSATSLVAGYHNVFNGYYYGANKLTGNILVTETLFTLPDNNGTIDINVVFDAIANQYTLKFDKNDTDLIGSASISPNTALTITYGSNYPTLPTGFLTGYTFNNWLLDLDNPTSVINPTKTVAIEAEHDAEVFAHATWTIKQYTIDVKINPEHSTYAILSSTGTLSTVPYNTLISIDSQQTEEVPTLTGTTEVVKTSILSILSTNFTATRRNATGYTTKFVKWTVNGADLLTDYTVGDTTSTIEILAHFERTANSYKLNFDLNASSLHLGSNATLVGSVPTFITYNSPYGTLPQGSLNGYTFLNWKKDGNIVSADTVVDTTEEITLVAEWEIIKYTISFESNNNEYGSIQNGNNLTIDYYTSITINNNVITIGATNITALVTEKPGYTTTFKDWTTNSLALTEITVTGDMNFVANFLRTANEYTITFVFNNGTADKTQKVTFGKPYNLNGDFPTSSLEGYNFSGWFLDDTTFTQQISEVDNVNIPNNHSLFAWWSINLFEISFEVNDLTLGDISPKSTISDVAYGTIITLGTNSINIGDVAVINASLNAFDGYTTAVEWEIEGHTLDNQFKITRSSTIKAVFSKTANTYKISFNVNTVDSNGEGLKGGTPELNGDENKDVVYDSTYDTLPEPTLTGYDFAGWYIGANKINETSIVKILEDSTLQAKWNIQYKTITININNAELGTVNTSTLTNIKYYSTLKTVAGSNEITAVMSTIDPSVTNTKTAKATPITKTGYTTEFINWTLDGNEISTLTIVEDITITAQFNRYANTYSVTFKANGGTPVTTSKTVVFDQKYGTLPVVTKTGHTFDIWTDEFGNEITSDTILSIAKNHDITAQWIVNKYNVSFVIYNDSLNIVDDEVGEVEQTTISNVHYNSTISQTGNVVSIIDSQTAATTNNTATKKLIIGYHVNFDRFTIDNVKFTNYVIPANDVTIEVRFTKVGRKYIVTFDSTGGTDAESIEVTYGSPYGELPSPTKTGYNFSTWTSDSTDSISAQTPVEIADDHTLSAVWDIKRYSIFFSANDSTLGKVSYNTISGVPHFATITISNTQLTIYSDTVVTIDAIPFETIKGYEVTLQDWTVNDAVVTSWTVEDFVEFHANFVQNALSYNVTFKANGGNIDNQTKTIRYDSTYGSLPSVTRTGYTFVGWYTDNNTFKKEIKPSTTMQTAYDHNIYAKWEINLFEISIVSNDEELGTVTKETLTNIPYGTKVSVTNNTIKIGFNYVSARVGYIYGYIIRFVNWTINNNNVENNMTVEDNFSIQANFTRQAKNIIITFNANTKDNYGQNLDGSPKLDEISKIIPFATTFGDLPTPTLEGYTFDGWYYDNQYSKKVKDTDSIDTIENLTLYAKWVKIVEPFNISEVLIYSGIGVVVVAIVVVAIVLLRKEKNKEKDTFDLGF